MKPFPWHRTYNTDLHDADILKLSDKDFRFLMRCRILANQNTPRGTLPSFEAMQKTLAMRADYLNDRLHSLIDSGHLNERSMGCLTSVEGGIKRAFNGVLNGALELVGWNRSQFTSDDSYQRVINHRANAKEQRKGENETFHETEMKRPQIQTTDTEVVSVSERDVVIPDMRIADDAHEASYKTPEPTPFALSGESTPARATKAKKQPVVSDDTFAAAWELRWNSKDKAGAIKAFSKAVPVVQAERKCSAPEAIEFLLTFLRRWKAEAERDPESAAAKKYMSFALNGKRWTDFEDEPVRKPATPVRNFADVHRELIAQHRAEQQRRAANA